MRLSLLLFPALACNEPVGDTGPALCDRSPALSWDNFGSTYLGRHCNGCHSSLMPESMRQGAPLGIDFDTYAGLLASADRVAARATGEDPSMPPGGGPSDDEIALFSEWLSCTVLPDAGAR
jgi:uncharacterized membrane protein